MDSAYTISVICCRCNNIINVIANPGDEFECPTCNILLKLLKDNETEEV